METLTFLAGDGSARDSRLERRALNCRYSAVGESPVLGPSIKWGIPLALDECAKQDLLTGELALRDVDNGGRFRLADEVWRFLGPSAEWGINQRAIIALRVGVDRLGK